MLRLTRSSVVLGAVTLAVLGSIAAPAAADDETPASFKAVNASGTLTFFETAEPLVAADTDSAIDIYAGGEGTMGLRSDRVQAGPDAEIDAVFRAINADGSRVFFETAEPIRAEDTDSAVDIYAGGLGTMGIRSDRVKPGADANNNATFRAINADGSLTFFTTREQIRAEDTDGRADIYAGGVGTMGLRSDRVQPGPDAGIDAVFKAVNGDGSLTFFETAEQIRAEDTDSAVDIYAGGLGTMGIRSDRVQPGADAAKPAAFKAINADGSLVFFTTGEQIRAEDGDGVNDIYAAGVGTMGLRSDRVQPGPDAGINAVFKAINGDGSLTFFETAEPIRAEDTDSAVDIYAGGLGTMGLRSDRVQPGADANNNAAFKAINAGGSRTFFETAEQIRAEDTDAAIDVYAAGVDTMGMRSDRVQPGPDAGINAVFRAINNDGSLTFFETAEQIRAEDTDSAIDIYAGGVDTMGMRSDRVQAGLDQNTAATFRAIKGDGSLTFFTTREQVRAEDTDGAIDIYAGGLGTMGLRSDRVQPGPDAPINAIFRAINADASRTFFETAEQIRAEDTDSATDIYAAGVGTMGMRSDRVQP